MKYLYELIDYDPAVTPTGTCVEDVQKKYLNTMVTITLVDKQEIFGILARINGRCISMELPNDTLEFEHRHIVSMKPFLPEGGYYQYENGGFFIKRNIRRQYKASYCQDLYTTHRWGGVTVEKYLSKEKKYPYTIDEIDIDSPRIALNKHLCVNPTNTLSLLYDQLPIGIIKAKKKVIQLHVPSIMQEVRDYLNKKQLGDVWKLTLPK
jgi:hypothetical protein